MSRLNGRRSGIVATALAAAVVVAGCGGNQRQDANEPSGKYPVSVVAATFPTSQRLAQHAHLVIVIRNDGHKTIPNLAVTICNVSCTVAQASQATGAQAFSENLQMPALADPSRPIWVVDRAPGPCQYSCQGGGPGGAVTAYTNTWTLGSVKPGRTVTFNWGVTAVKAGTHIVSWEVAAGLNGKAKAVLNDGTTLPAGKFKVTITTQPVQSYVNDQGHVVTTP